jgi:hypothetical protein
MSEKRYNAITVKRQNAEGEGSRSRPSPFNEISRLTDPVVVLLPKKYKEKLNKASTTRKEK